MPCCFFPPRRRNRTARTTRVSRRAATKLQRQETVRRRQRPVGDTVSEALAQVSAQTNLRWTLHKGRAYFATGAHTGINFPWHRITSFFVLQNHYDT